MFGGTDLAHSEDWVRSTIDFATDGFIGAQAIKQYPHALRPLAAKFIPAIVNIKKHLEIADRVIVPVLEARRAAEAAGVSNFRSHLLPFLVIESSRMFQEHVPGACFESTTTA